MQQQFNGKKANSRTYHQFSKLVNSAMHEPVNRRPLGLTAEDINASPPRQPVSKPATPFKITGIFWFVFSHVSIQHSGSLTP